jgi:hypothetical protein
MTTTHFNTEPGKSFLAVSRGEAAEIHGLVTHTLVKHGYRPFGADGTTWEHPSGVKVSTGYAGGQIRVRRHPVATPRHLRIPPIVWDVRSMPTEEEVAEFVGQPRPARDLSPSELETIARFNAAEAAPESFRKQIEKALADEMDALGMSPGRFYAPALADAVIGLLRGEA